VSFGGAVRGAQNRGARQSSQSQSRFSEHGPRSHQTITRRSFVGENPGDPKIIRQVCGSAPRKRDAGWCAVATHACWQAVMADKRMAGKVWRAESGKSYGHNLQTPCGEKHSWKQMSDFVKHCRKYKCEREGCGFFKKCWTACTDIDCKGCHVPGHKRW
jgi:hypothetical protein